MMREASVLMAGWQTSMPLPKVRQGRGWPGSSCPARPQVSMRSVKVRPTGFLWIDTYPRPVSEDRHGARWMTFISENSPQNLSET
jgi:hypothetical protein